MAWKKNSCGKIALGSAVGAAPEFEQDVLHGPHRLFLGDAGVGDPVELPIEQRLLVIGCEIAVVGHPNIVVVGDQVEDVLLEVGAGAADGVHLALPDHLGERQTELCGGHGAGHGEEHLAAGSEVLLVGGSGIDQGGGVEVAVVVGDEFSYIHGSHAS